MSRIKISHPGCLPAAILLAAFFPSVAFGGSLAEQNSWRLKRAAGIFASEIIKRGVPKLGGQSDCAFCHKGDVRGVAVYVPDFTDIKGRPVREGAEVSAEFKRQLRSAGHSIIFSSESEAEFSVKGVLLPFKGRERWKLGIKLFRADSPVTSYEGILTGR